MGPIGPMMTRTWVRIARDVIGEVGPRRRYANLPRTVGASVGTQQLPPAQWEELLPELEEFFR